MSKTPDRSALSELGMDDFFSQMRELDGVQRSEDSSYAYGGRVLLSGRAYALPCVDADDLVSKVSLEFSGPPPVVMNFLEDNGFISPGVFSDTYYAGHIQAAIAIMDAHIADGDKLFLLTPGLALRTEDGEPLSFAIEIIKRHLSKYASEDVVVIIADMDVHEGKSDARRTIRKMVDTLPE